ncbi:unnamed protein product [Leptidea sinapis]|uniref:Ion transport domain-containing protein n=1 Tax=Leptidea sinapis TaxID=189913 RepID=A0A5E4PZ96_9NEOP|nr:unnamed protein product [Leptidea sinapis]
MERDVEQGISEEQEKLPLLNKPQTRPQAHKPNSSNGLEGVRRRPSPKLPPLILEPPSTLTTPDTTPGPDTSDTWPKKWRRSDRRHRRLNTELLEAIESHNIEEIERLLKAGANPNATCRLDLVSACHMAALGGGDALSLLVKYGAEKHRLDTLGRTPLHLAAYAGNARQMAILLDLSEEMQCRVESDDMSSEAEEDVKKLCQVTKAMANVRCGVGEINMSLPTTWKDNIDHNCVNIKGSFPLLQPGWTPLHVAASCARRHCTRLLLAAGADPNVCDVLGRTALDVVGSAHYYGDGVNLENLTEVIKTLIKSGGTFNSMRRQGLNNIDTPLHTAVELENIDSIKELLDIGASITCLNPGGQTPLHLCVKKQLEEPLQILANYTYADADPLAAMVDVKDRDGHTVLQAAVEEAWVPGVCVALEAGADVNLKANDGETTIHSAASLGNIDVLLEILSVAKQHGILDGQNEEGETPLFKAIKNGHKECVKALLDQGASVKILLPGDVNVLHVATEYDQKEILKILLEYNNGKILNMIDSLTANDRRGFGPIHFAVYNNSVDCLELLLSKNADIRLRTSSSPHFSSTPLHLAAVKNYKEVAMFIIKYDKTVIHEVNSMGWFPLHSASHHGSRDVISLLLQEGADLSGYTDGPRKYRKTAIDMLINNLSKPTEFLEDTFNSYITSNTYYLEDSNCEIIVDYRILMPTICEMEQMKVIEALLKTGNRYGQKRLLVHPLVESFLYLKWKALLPFFYTIIAVYAFFVSSLTIFIISLFFFKDTNVRPPILLTPWVWGNIVYASIILIILQEILYMNIKSARYFCQMETWIKFGSVCLATALPPAVYFLASVEDEWPRHIATLALLLSWLELMFLLSRFPNWGYYVLMFGKVASNVVKILLTFAFLVIGFSLSFMIQFHSEMPFETPWAAFVKTVVMMTSEFDYVALFDEEHTEKLATSLVIVRLIFLIFLILAAIVLMNLMVGVAVSDINDLEILGNINRLAKQVEFLSTLDNLVYNRFFTTILPQRVNEHIKCKRKVLNTITMSPGKPRWRSFKILPSYLRDALLTIAHEQKKIKDQEIGSEEFTKKIDEMHEAITKLYEEQTEKNELKQLENKPLYKFKYEDVLKRLSGIDDGIDLVKSQLNDCIEGAHSPIEKLTVKIDQISLEMENIKQFLSRLESKLGR